MCGLGYSVSENPWGFPYLNESPLVSKEYQIGRERERAWGILNLPNTREQESLYAVRREMRETSKLPILQRGLNND
ncbi:hypothetical protein J6590_065845 [Homalodisca vitripennis]|nr:hypothetical protein J6590_065845 [Homalodisca vitripennis]